MATETDGFAELVRGLKERSGLSYGALARKLHMSTSTLHRYCNGDAVPTEFGPVERLGRLCGATREELVELHRRWILADDARGRRTAPEPAPMAPANPAAPAVVVSEGAEPPTPQPQAEPVVTVRAPSSEAGSRSRKRLRIVLAAAVVVALAVPVAYGIGRSVSGDGAEQDADQGKAGEAPAGGTSAPPLSVGISSYNWAGPCGQHYMLDRQPEKVPSPPPPQDSRGWAAAFDGVDGGHMNLELTATGRTDAAVVITGLQVRVVERAEPLAGAAYFMGDGCGGGVTPQTFDIDLDAQRPTPKPVAGQDGDHKVPAKDFPYKVSTSDPQVLNLDVHTESHLVSWYLEVEWSSGEQRGTIPVNDGGKPFRTSAMEGKKVYSYRFDKDAWAAG